MTPELEKEINEILRIIQASQVSQKIGYLKGQKEAKGGNWSTEIIPNERQLYFLRQVAMKAFIISHLPEPQP